MLSDANIAAGEARLETGKLSPVDMRRMVSSLRLLLGPLESKYSLDLKTSLTALDDTTDTEKKAAQMAACLILLMAEEFDVDKLDTELQSDADDQRRIYQIYALSLLMEIPEELMDELVHRRYSTSFTTTTHDIVTVP